MEVITVYIGILNPDKQSIARTVPMRVTPEVLFHLRTSGEPFAASGATAIRGQKDLYRFVDAPPGHYSFEFTQGYDGHLEDQPGLWMFFAEKV